MFFKAEGGCGTNSIRDCCYQRQVSCFLLCDGMGMEYTHCVSTGGMFEFSWVWGWIKITHYEFSWSNTKILLVTEKCSCIMKGFPGRCTALTAIRLQQYWCSLFPAVRNQGWHCCLPEQLEGLPENVCLIHHVECMKNIILKAFKWHLQVLVVDYVIMGLCLSSKLRKSKAKQRSLTWMKAFH